MSRKSFYITRTIHTALLLMVVLTILFFLFRFMPGDFEDIILPATAPEETRQAIRAQWGLDEPLYVQFFTYVVNFFQGDWGTSMVYHVPVSEYILIPIVNTFILVAPGVTAGYLIGTALGTIIGNRRDSRLEKSVVVGIITLGSFPGFFIGLMVIIVFASMLGWFPTSGMLSPGVASQYSENWWRVYLTGDFLKHYTLPFITVVFRYTYAPTMIMRTSTIEVSDQDFLYYHKVTGLPYVTRLMQTAKHSVLPVITLFPISMAKALSGLVVIEFVFNWPGIGFALVQAVLDHDFPVVQAIFFITASFIIISNFVIDILYSIIDPRITLDEN